MTKNTEAAAPTAAQIIYVKFKNLELSPLNTRKVEPTAIDELAALIRSAGGLVQNLVGVVMKGKKGKYGVVGGGRRLRALGKLVADGIFTVDTEFPLLVVSQADAVMLSLAENHHEEMHPADQAQAMQDLIAAGKTDKDCAQAFGLPLQTVRQRLKLATVSPLVTEKFRAGTLTIEQVAAFAITDDHTMQESVLKSMGHRNSPYHIKEALTPDELPVKDNRDLAFVGMRAYKAAGGEIRTDIFNQNGGFIIHPEKLKELSAAKLEKIKDEVAAEGWGFVLVESIGESYRYNRAPAPAYELPPEVATRVAEMEKKVDELEVKIDALWDSEEDTNDERRALSNEQREFQTELDAIREEAEEKAWATPEAKAKAGALVCLDGKGKVEIIRARLRPGQGQERHKEAARGPRPLHSDKLSRRLNAHRTIALQAMTAANTRVALAALAATLAEPLFDQYHESALTISLRDCESALHGAADDMADSRGFAELRQHTDKWTQIFGGIEGSFLPTILAMDETEVLELLAYCAARSVNSLNHGCDSEHDQAATLQKALGLDMADYWQATADGYFAHVSKDTTITACTEALPDGTAADAIEGLKTCKKREAADRAETLIDGARWLPAPLRAAA